MLPSAFCCCGMLNLGAFLHGFSSVHGGCNREALVLGCCLGWHSGMVWYRMASYRVKDMYVFFIDILFFFLTSYAGYQARSCYQPEAVNVTLRLLVCAAPIVLILIGLLLFKLYPIDEEKRKENRKALQLIR